MGDLRAIMANDECNEGADAAREGEGEEEQGPQSLGVAGLLDVSQDALLHVCSYLPREDFVCRDRRSHA